MDKKLFGIGILSLMAVVLLVANVIPVQPAGAAAVIKDRDYQIVTARIVSGGEALYVLDNRTGLVAAFVWDNGARRVVPRDVKPMSFAFGG
jgi:hypothetical protein